MSDAAGKPSHTAGPLQALVLLLPVTMLVMGAVVLQPDQGLLMAHFKDVPGNEYWVPFLLTVPAIAATCFTVPAGYLADLFGRRPVLLISMLVYVVVGVGPFFLQNLAPIAACRICVGLCEGVGVTVTTALLGDYFKGAVRDRYLGLQVGLAAVSASLLIPLSGWLGGRFGWNGPFLVYGITLLWFLGILFFTWEPAPDERAGEKAGSVSWAGFPWRRTLALSAVTLVGGYFFYTVQYEVPTILPRYGVTDAARIGALSGVISWGMVAGALVFQLIVRGGLYALLIGELIVIAATFIAMGSAPTSGSLVALGFVNQIACGALLPTLLTTTMRFLPFEHRGRGTGIWQGVLSASQFIVGMSFPAITHATGGDRSHTMFLIGIAAAGCVVLAVIGALRQRATETHPAS